MRGLSRWAVWWLVGCVPDVPASGPVLVENPDARTHVWMFRSTNGVWTRHPSPLAHSMSSLGVGNLGDTLVLTGQCWWGSCGSEIHRWLSGPPVHGIQTRDLVTWTPAMWRLDDPAGMIPIDTEIVVRPEGTSLWYYGVPVGPRGDPAKRTADHRLRRASLDDGQFVQPVDVVVGPHLADPIPVWFRGERLLFATSRPGAEVSQYSGDPPVSVQTWKGVSVPHAMVVDDELWLWAQRIRNGRRSPVRARSSDGRTFTEWETPLPNPGKEDCANPVGTVFRGEPVMFCLSEPSWRLGPPTPP